MVRINPSNSPYPSLPIGPSHMDKQDLRYQLGDLVGDLRSGYFDDAQNIKSKMDATIEAWQKNRLINADTAKNMHNELNSIWTSATEHNDSAMDQGITNLYNEIQNC
jgi:hypothetical protein